MNSEPVSGPATSPGIRFHRLFKNATKPVQADNSAAGLLPTRAYRYCEAARVASSLGWYLFPPITFSLRFDGHAIHWKPEGGDWAHLDNAILEEDREFFESICPDDLQGHAPSMIGAADGGLMQIFFGFAVTTNPGWGVLLRKPPNVPQKSRHEVYEGFVRTDLWLGPLFTNFQPLQTDVEMRFDRDWPLAFLQPVPVAAIERDCIADVSFSTGESPFTDDQWVEFGKSLLHRLGPDREVAQYARFVRKGS